jgi:UDP-glucose 4-epimerase
MRTLLTGAGGYIGLHIVRELLADGQHVTAVVRSSDKLLGFGSESRLHVVEADLQDDARMGAVLPGHDVCVHAAIIWGDPSGELEGRDAAITSKLFDAAGNAGLKRGIFLSSAAVHRPFAGEMSEEDWLSPTDLYAANKAAGELFLRAACARHQMTGIVVRPGPVVGLPMFASGSCRSPNRLSQMICAAVEGLPVEAVRGEGRQFSDVSMVARSIRILTRANNPLPAYICVDQQILTWEHIAHIVVSYVGSSGGVRILPGDSREPVPHFRTQRIESLLGGRSNAESALRDHIRHLAQSMGVTPVEK